MTAASEEKFSFDLTADEERRAHRLHKEAIIVDTLGDALQQDSLFFSKKMKRRTDELIASKAPRPEIIDQMHVAGMEDLLYDSERQKEYLGWWDESGVTATSITIGPWGEEAFSYGNAVRDLARWTRKFDSLDFLIKVTNSKDIIRAKETGRKGIIFNFQNTTHIGRDIGKLEFFYDLGIRIIQLSYNDGNYLGDGCMERRDCGLTKFGLRVIEEMNRLGLLIDLSHCGRQTTLEAIEASARPVAVTHSFCHDLNDHPRGKADEILEKLAARGGYLGILLLPSFISSEDEVDLNAFLDHVDHAIAVMGPDKVGIGTDTGQIFPDNVRRQLDLELIDKLGFPPGNISGYDKHIKGFEYWTKWPNLTRGLVSRGHSDESIKGILGLNFHRVFSQAVG